MARQKIADYLFQRIKKEGVEWTFGIPGDFVLPVYAAQERANLKTLVMSHEPSVGFAADAYGRMKGLGVALVTYGAGGLNMVNATALAYAEESPLLVVSGSPETHMRGRKPELHHCVKTFDTQFNVFKEVTESQALIDDVEDAQTSIDHIFKSIKKSSRPGYIELPRDLVNAELEIIESTYRSDPTISPTAQVALQKLSALIAQATQPVLFVGAEIRRFNLLPQIIALSEALELPVVTSILGKASFPESHPNFIGTYFGAFGEPAIANYVESSDCLLCLGVVLTEMETGGYTARLAPEKMVLINAHEISFGEESFDNVNWQWLLKEVHSSAVNGPLKAEKFSIPQFPATVLDSASKPGVLTVNAILDHLNKILDEKMAVVCDVGDCLYAGLSLKTDVFVAPGFYSSMGFGVPGGIGVQLAAPHLRSLILVGDGGFQMTGTEIATAVKLGINPIIVVFNNSSYAMLRFIDQKRDYYNLSTWDYCQVAQGLGAKAMRAETKLEFAKAIDIALLSDGPFLVDAVIAENDISPTLRRLTDLIGSRVRASIS